MLFIKVVVLDGENEAVLFNVINGFVMVWRMCEWVYDGNG